MVSDLGASFRQVKSVKNWPHVLGCLSMSNPKLFNESKVHGTSKSFEFTQFKFFGESKVFLSFEKSLVILHLSIFVRCVPEIRIMENTTDP